MLTREDNDLLTQVGPGRPMGELFRRFWLPAMLPAELPQADCDPVRIRLLGENLVAFRDTDGRVGFLAQNCPHRGASLFFGRNEERGLRCVYHGWKFDVEGHCLDMPNEPAESNFKDKIRHTAYPAREWGGLIWIYMGPRDRMPELPQIEWALLPDSHRGLYKWEYDANYMQAMEGEIDSSHTGFLHATVDGGQPADGPALALPLDLWKQDKSPRLTVEDTDYGFVYGSRRTAGSGRYYWRLTHWLLPTFSLIPNPDIPLEGRCYVPIDDEHTWTFGYMFRPDRPLSREEIAITESGVGNVPRMMPGSFRPVVNRENDFLLDREVQRTSTYTGIGIGVNEQDMAIVQSMGSIIDRTGEHLGSADIGVIAARRRLLRMARELADGKEPYAASHGDVYRVRALDALEPLSELTQILERYASQVMLPA